MRIKVSHDWYGIPPTAQAEDNREVYKSVRIGGMGQRNSYCVLQTD